MRERLSMSGLPKIVMNRHRSIWVKIEMADGGQPLTLCTQMKHQNGARIVGRIGHAIHKLNVNSFLKLGHYSQSPNFFKSSRNLLAYFFIQLISS